MFYDVVNFIQACEQQKSKKNQELYKSLIVEEFEEFLNAVSEKNDVEQLDACMDMIWVILGYCHMKGYDVVGAWGEVALSNLCKVDPTTGKVRKREDGKILKPEGWKPPQLGKYVGEKK